MARRKKSEATETEIANVPPEILPLKDPRKIAMVVAMRSKLGIVYTACQAVGISRTAHYNWLKSDPLYKELIEEVQEITLDVVEGKLLQHILAGDITSVIFYLKTKGRSRGYGQDPVDNTNQAEIFDEDVTLDIPFMEDFMSDAILDGE